MADLDLEIMQGREGGGDSQKCLPPSQFFVPQPYESQIWSKNKGMGTGPPGAFPGAAQYRPFPRMAAFKLFFCSYSK